jgi:hypothetical protein
MKQSNCRPRASSRTSRSRLASRMVCLAARNAGVDRPTAAWMYARTCQARASPRSSLSHSNS